jgi:DNA-binding MarR family transcriptional regulator
VVECGLTEAGRHLIDEISGTRLELMRKVLAVLNAEELAQMAGLITTMATRIKSGTA